MASNEQVKSLTDYALDIKKIKVMSESSQAQKKALSATITERIIYWIFTGKSEEILLLKQ